MHVTSNKTILSTARIFFFLLSFYTATAQTDTTLLPEKTMYLSSITVSDNLDTTKYFWNLLKYNYDLYTTRDTIVYYHLSVLNKIPDSAWIEQFTGIVRIHFLHKKVKIALCSGSYFSNFDTTFKIHRGIGGKLRFFAKYPKYSKFKRDYHIGLKNDTFVVVFPNKTRYIHYKFEKKLLTYSYYCSTDSHFKSVRWFNQRQIIKLLLIDYDYYEGRAHVISSFILSALNEKELNLKSNVCSNAQDIKGFIPEKLNRLLHKKEEDNQLK